MKRLIILLIIIFGINIFSFSQDTVVEKRITFSGKAVLRITEADWKQKRMDDTGQIYYDDDRYWSRYNFYLNMKAKLANNLYLKSQIRTGNKQYAFVTFGANKDERFNIILSELYLLWQKNDFKLKFGRQTAGGIWKNQKGAQFDIPTHDGISLSKKFHIGDFSIIPQVAFFDEKYRNNTSYALHGKMYGGSVLFSGSLEKIDWHLQTGVIFADHLPNRYENDIAEDDNNGVRYHDGDLAENYSLSVSQIYFGLPKVANLAFTGDFYFNFYQYDKNPQSHLIKPFGTVPAPDFSNERMGFITTLSVGDYGKAKSFYAGLSYLYIEKYASMDYFAQYDYSRWASSNISGLEACVGYRFNKYIAIKTRFFKTEEIKGYNAINPDYKRSAYRMRFDLNISF